MRRPERIMHCRASGYIYMKAMVNIPAMEPSSTVIQYLVTFLNRQIEVSVRRENYGDVDHLLLQPPRTVNKINISEYL